MKNISPIILVGLLTGCHGDQFSTTASARGIMLKYQQIHAGMSRREIYHLLGKPCDIIVEGAGVPEEFWVDGLGGHRADRLSVLFGTDGRVMKVEIDTVTLK